MSPFRTAILAGAALLATTAAQAASITFGAVAPFLTVPVQSTDFNTAIAVPLFDSTLGTLTGISFTLSGTAISSVGVESTDATATSINAAISAILTLQRPDTTSLVVTIPTFNTVFNLGAADGTIDFGGPAGAQSNNNSSSDSDSASSSSAADLALFQASGGGSINLFVDASADSSFDGSGNIITSVSTDAGASLIITYTFDVPTTEVPEPASMALIGAGLFGLGLARRRKA